MVLALKKNIFKGFEGCFNNIHAHVIDTDMNAFRQRAKFVETTSASIRRKRHTFASVTTLGENLRYGLEIL